MKKTRELIYQTIIKLLFAFLYALFITLGDYDRVLAWSGPQTAWRLAGWTALAFVALSVLFMAADLGTGADTGAWNFLQKNRGGKDKGAEARMQRRNSRKYMYFLFAVVCFLCWLPYFLIYFPGWVSNDTVWQLEQACGWVEPSNHHPWMHTMIIKAFFMLGFRIFGTYTGAVATFVFAQMVFMALVYAIVLYDFYRRGVRWLWLALAVFFYACLPVNGLYAVCMGKDVIFAGVLLLYAREVYRYSFRKTEHVSDMTQPAQGRGSRNDGTGSGTVRRKEKYIGCLNWLQENGNDIRLGILGLLVCMLRSNGILVFAGTAVFMIAAGVFRKNWLRAVICTVAVLVCYMVYHGPVLGALQVTQPDTIEGLTMPTQHLLSAYLNGGEVTEEEAAMMGEVVPMEYIASYYNPYYFDIVKEYIRSEGNQQVIADNKGKYLALWARVGLRNPAQYLEAEVRQTCGYWCFDINEPIYEQYRMAENPFGLTTQRKVFSYDFGLWMDDFLMKFQDFYNRVWSLGLTTWTMLACMAYMLYRRRSCLACLPYVMLFMSLLLATPVHAEFRYTYGMFVALPFLIGITLTKADSGCVYVEGTDSRPDRRNGEPDAQETASGQPGAEQEEK